MKPIASPQYLPGRRPRNAGVALVIVLAFVVIITGVILAFFSQSLFTRQISDASASQAKADLLAQGASESIIADLQQEIVLGSTVITATNQSTHAVTNVGYAPGAPAYMLPQLSGTDKITGVTWAPNFLIRSAANDLFFTGSNARIPTSGSSTAIAVSSTTPSLNGRTVSLTTWNSHYLLPLSSTSADSTPYITSTSYFQAPDWVLVTRSGSAAAWSTSLTNPAISNSNYVIGRYAYAVYHEGGLLDANVAGFPADHQTDTSVSGTANKPALAYADLTQLPGGFYQNQPAVNQFVAWRNYASALATGTQVNNLSFTASGNMTSGSSYFNFLVNNPNSTGFLSVGSAGLNQGYGSTSGTASGQSDRMFGSRQELIAFLQNGLGMSGTSLQVLNYLATFTRGLNQPSIAPSPTRPLISSTESATNGANNAVNLDNQINPPFLTARVTGTFTRNDGSQAQIGEPLVKKRFALSKLAWITYLGPSAYRVVPTTNPGTTSPNYDMWQLVHTYGISPTYLAQGTWQNVAKYFGLHWLQDSIPPSSGRSAQAASFHDGEFKWFYKGHQEIGQSAIGVSNPSSVTISNTYGAISRLQDIAAVDGVTITGTNAREPDFFELLKASVMAGSKAKGAFNSTNGLVNTPPTNPLYYQTNRDTSLDYAIIQLGANIIDEAKVDGYATRIVFTDSTGIPHEFRGVENLPYLYRVNSGILKLRMESSPMAGTTKEEDSGPNANPSLTFRDTGVGAVMAVPTIWNPYDRNSPLGDPAPDGPNVFPSLVTSSGTNFRLIADSADPDSLAAPGALPTQSTSYSAFAGTGQWHQVIAYAQTGNPLNVANLTYTVGANGAGGPISPALNLPSATTAALTPIYPGNSCLGFVVPDATYFREPTILAQPNSPNGSRLQMAAPTHITQYATIQNSAGKPAWVNAGANSGFHSDGPNPLSLPAASAPSTTGTYVGFPLALMPIEFPGPAYTTGTIGVYEMYIVTLNFYGANLGDYLDYRMQYKDPNTSSAPFVAGAQFEQAPGFDTGNTNWETYDEKYNSVDCLFLSPPFYTAYGNLTDQADGAQGGDWESYADPRTSRFGAINGTDLGNPVQTPGGANEAGEWADPGNDVSVTDRPDFHSGYAITANRFSNDAEFTSLAAAGWSVKNQTSGGHFRIGLLSQNNPGIGDDGIRFATDNSQSYSTSPEGPNYYADPDNVVRGAMGNYVQGSSGTPASTIVGLPLATAYPSSINTIGNPGSSATGAYQGQSRPYFLHRPFLSVGELGYVFSGTPWKNIDFFTPQSGDSSLLDVFTTSETPPAPAGINPMVAGVVNLNTRQAPVLQAVLTGATVDEAQTSGTTNTGFTPLTASQVNQILNGSFSVPNLLARTAPSNTTTNQGPFINVSDMVGRWNQQLETSGSAATGYSGFMGDLTSIYGSIFSGNTLLTMQNVDRFREAVIRPLSAVGNTRVWNLLIDVVAQTGRYPSGTASPANFVVDGQQRYWVHVAIDRFTGQVLDKQVEVVKQ